jgi:hypothetical protein
MAQQAASGFEELLNPFVILAAVCWIVAGAYNKERIFLFGKNPLRHFFPDMGQRAHIA